MPDGKLDPRMVRSRAALVIAMTELLDQRGVEDITITDVVRQAGVTRPTFYQHFADILGIARAACFFRLEAAFPPENSHAEADTNKSAQELLTEVTRDTTAILKHMKERRDFYGRVLRGAGSVELFESLVQFLEQRLISDPAMKIQSSVAITPADRARILAGGVVWMVTRWLDSDFQGENSVSAMADRIAGALLVLRSDANMTG